MASAASSPQSFPYPSTLNVGNFVSIKLTQTNFLLSKTQIMGLIESQDMVGFINGEYPAPPKTLPADAILETESAANATFAAWRRSDRLLRGWITGTLSEEVLGLVVGLETSAEVWHTLEGSFAKESQEWEFYLVQQLQMHRKGTSSLDDYIRTFKGYCDDLSAIGKPVADRQKVFSLLCGLGPSYEPFVTSMLKPPTPSYREIIPLLQGHETMRTMHISDGFVPPNPTVAFFGQKQNGGKRFNQKGKQSGHFTSTGRGFPPAAQLPNQDQGDLGEKPQARNTDKQNPNDRTDKGTICQICNKPNHSAMRCLHRFNQTYQPGDAAQALAAFNLAISPQPGFDYQQQIVPGMRPGGGPMPNFFVPIVPQGQQGQRLHGGRAGAGPVQQTQQPVPMLPRGGRVYRFPPGPNMPEGPMPGVAGGTLSVPYDMGGMPVREPQPISIGALASAIANATPEQQRTMLGESLYPLVDAIEHDMAAKVTGMLLEMDQTEVLHLLESPEALNSKVAEAMDVQRNVAQQPDQLAALSLKSE